MKTQPNNPKGQHDLPETYLKRFAIDPKSRKLKRMVFCCWWDGRKYRIEDISIGASLFKNEDFYTIDHPEKPYAFEHFFRDEIEWRYNEIMAEIEAEQELSLKCRQHLILWLYYNKFRNKVFRDRLERFSDFNLRIPYALKNGKMAADSKREEFKEQAKLSAKDIQLMSLIDEQQRLDFEKGLGVKSWKIVWSKHCPFITNNDPGFSINIDMYDRFDINSLNSFFSTNAEASNFFPLSPKYCLKISPHKQGDLLDNGLRNKIIRYEESEEVDFINRVTASIETKYLVSNSKEVLLRYTESRIKK